LRRKTYGTATYSNPSESVRPSVVGPVGASIDKDSQEHFEIRTHKRLIDVINPDSRTIESLTKLNLPAGVDIEIKL